MACNEEDSGLQVLGCLAQSLSNGLRRLLPLVEGEIHLQHCMRQTGKLVWELYCSNLVNITDHDVGAFQPYNESGTCRASIVFRSVHFQHLDHVNQTQSGSSGCCTDMLK